MKHPANKHERMIINEKKKKLKKQNNPKRKDSDLGENDSETEYS